MRLFLFLFGILIAFSSKQVLSAAEETGLALPSGIWECHGTAKLRGQTTASRFWIRILPPDATYGHHRIVQVVYTPPVPATLGGTHLSDTPYWLLDTRTRLMAWNDRGTSSLMQPAAGAYQVTRERTPSDDTNIVLDEKKFTVSRGWDRTAAPLLLALSWRLNTELVLPCIDLFGNEPDTTISWHGPQVHLGSDTWTVLADEQGRLAKLLDASGAEVLSVTAWLASGTSSESSEKPADTHRDTLLNKNSGTK